MAGLSEQAGEEAIGGDQLVKAVLAGAAVPDQAGLLQLRKMRRDGALAHDQNLLQLGHGEFLAAEKQQNAEPVGFSHGHGEFLLLTP